MDSKFENQDANLKFQNQVVDSKFENQDANSKF